MDNQDRSYFRSLQGKINLSLFFIVAVAVVSFLLISVYQSRLAVENTAVEYTSQLIDMVNGSIDSYITNLEHIARIAVEDSDVKHYLFSAGGDLEAEEAYGKEVSELFRTLKDTGNDIINIGVIGENGRYLINDAAVLINPYAELSKMAWYENALSGEEVITSPHVQNIVSNEYQWVVTLSQMIPGTGRGGDAVFFVDLNFSSISRLCESINLGSKGYAFILDNQGNLLYHPRQQLIYSGLWEEEFSSLMQPEENAAYSADGQKLYIISKSDVTGWTVVGVAYVDEMLARTDRLRSLFYLMAVVLMGVALLLSILLTDMVTLPLRRLRASMQVVESGNLNVEIEEMDTGDEIADLFHSFRNMVLQIRKLMEQNTAEQREKRKSELNALQAQINPHFLYNTLDSIIWMAEGGNTKNVVLMTSSLAKLLRRSISNNKETVTLREEIEYTRSYLTIQKMRYADKLEYEIDVEEAALQVEIIKLIVQPLVENAIYHGIKYKEGKGLVRITGGFEGDELLLHITDNGVGMTQEELSHIFDERETDMRKNSVGVLNVHRRIRLYYGMEYGLSFESRKNAGTTVTIRLPAAGVAEHARLGGDEEEKADE